VNVYSAGRSIGRELIAIVVVVIRRMGTCQTDVLNVKMDGTFSYPQNNL
jgi:hypothetical protein